MIRTSRKESLKVECPLCGAAIGEECNNREGASHSPRHEAAVAAGARVIGRKEMWASSRYHRRQRAA